MPDKRVLIIAYHYPPLAGAGMLKILRTTRYLPQSGWEPLVLTVKNPEPYHRAANPIPAGVRLFTAWRIPGGNLCARILRRLHLDERWLLLPDQYTFWIPGLLWRGWRIIRREKPALIYVTGPPYSALIAATLLHKWTKTPLIADIRDPWSFNAARRRYPTPLHRRLDRALERWVLRSATFVTCIYRMTAEGYQRLYPWMGQKLAVFYDTVDLADLPQRAIDYPVFTLTYLGTFYPPFRSLKATFQALRLLAAERAITPDSFHFNYVGPPDKSFERLAHEYGLTNYFKCTGYKTLAEAQEEAFCSQLLLLLLEFPTINTKLFDYLAAGKPILAVVPEFAELNELLEKYADRYDKVIDLDPAKIVQAIKRRLTETKIATHTKRERFLVDLNIEAETKELAALFTKAAGKGGRA